MLFFSKKQRYLRKLKKTEPKCIAEGLTGLMELSYDPEYHIDVPHILSINDHAILNLFADFIFKFLPLSQPLLNHVWTLIDTEDYFTGAALVIKRLERLLQEKYLSSIQGTIHLDEAARLIQLTPVTLKTWQKKGDLPLLSENDTGHIHQKDLYRLIFEQTSLAYSGYLCDSCVFSCKKRVPRNVTIPLDENTTITQLCSWFKEKGIYDITRSLCKYCKKDCEDLFPRAELKGELLVSICNEFEPKSGWESAKFAKI